MNDTQRLNRLEKALRNCAQEEHDNFVAADAGFSADDPIDLPPTPITVMYAICEGMVITATVGPSGDPIPEGEGYHATLRAAIDALVNDPVAR